MSLLLALFMALGSMGSTVAFATDLEENSQNSEVDELVSELKFYLRVRILTSFLSIKNHYKWSKNKSK